jgi:hypothetical protein
MALVFVAAFDIIWDEFGWWTLAKIVMAIVLAGASFGLTIHNLRR